MGEPDVARCSTCGTRYTARAWPWLEWRGSGGNVRTCAVPGCGSLVERERASATALRLAAVGRGGAANDAPPVIDNALKRSESPVKQAPKKAAKKAAPQEPEAPAIISIRGHTAEDHAAFQRARSRISAKAGGAFVSLSQAVLVLARTQAAREDAEERARAEAAKAATHVELLRRYVAARRAVEASTADGWRGTAEERRALCDAEAAALGEVMLAAGVGRASRVHAGAVSRLDGHGRTA